VALAAVPLLALSALLVPAPPGVHAAASLTLSRQMAVPQDAVTVTGSGFASRVMVITTANFQVGNRTVTVKRGSVTDDIGTYHARFAVPAGSVPGFYTVRARDFQNQVATATLHILPLVDLRAGAKSPPTFDITAGRLFYVSGSRFQSKGSVKITATFPLFNGNSVTVNKNPTADARGSFHDVLVQAPFNAKQGTLSMTATGSISGKQATSTLNVIYQPAITLGAPAARPGQDLSVTGAGFVPNVTVHVSLPVQTGSTTTTMTKDVTTDDKGAFTITLNLPGSLQQGSYTVTAKGTAIGLTAAAKLAISLKAAIAAQPATVSPGETVKITGSGYSANATVYIKLTVPLFGGGSKPLDTTVTTDAQGAFTTSLHIPGHAAAGSVTIAAQGPHTASHASLTIKHVPAIIAVTPQTLAPGSSVTIKGSGYPAGDTVDISVPVKLVNSSTQTLAMTAHADANGQFTVHLNVPGTVATGNYTLVAKSALSGRAPTARLSLSVSGRISLAPNNAQPGHAITVNGSGFGANVSVTVSATFGLYGGGTRTVSVKVQTDAQGTLTGHISIPSNAAAGPVTIQAQGPNARATARLMVNHLPAAVTVSPASVVPGSTLHVTGSGYLANSKITVSVSITMLDGSKKTLTTTATTDAKGQFAASLQIPGNAKEGSYTVSARAQSSGRVRTATVSVAKLAPSIVAVPPTAVPGTDVTVNGFGFAPGAAVTINLQGSKVGSATANNAGQFLTKVTIPSGEASGSYTLSAASSSGRTASFNLAVNRQVSTHFYFASLYTGTNYHEYLAILNPTETRAKVTITYQLTNGSTKSATASVNAHTRYTEDVNADLGPKVSSAAAVAADVPVVVERLVIHGADQAIVPGATAPATSWYFANGNTSGRYREYIAIQNPSASQIQVAIHFLPTHHRQFTITRTMAPTSRTTVKVSSYVRDAVGVIVTSGSPIVANRSMFIRHGTTSKIGVTAPQRSWYFAGGPRNPQARNYLAAINPRGRRTHVTLHIYSPSGQELDTVQQWLKPYARVFYLMNRIVRRTDVAAVLTASSPIVAEQTTYANRMHDAATDSFGVPAAARSWAFAAASTSYVRSSADVLDLFNPSLAPVPVVVQFIDASGKVTSRTYVVSPLSHQIVDVGSVMPNADLGLVATSDQPFVALNRMSINNGRGADTSRGIPIK
jgi:5-hydroxyisourate hydrolase-like protein (transthyretin family)